MIDFRRKEMSEEGEQPRETLASAAYRQLRREIVSAELPPGSKLRIRALCDRFDVGLAPMREALSRLSSEGFVRQFDQRGFSVAPLSEGELDDIIRARCWINRIGLRESILHGGEEWEEALLLAFHRMTKVPRLSPEPMSRSPAWAEAHRAFHAALVSACRSVWLTNFCDLLFEAAERYRCFARPVAYARSTEDEHEAIMKAALAHDSEKACALLERHFETTAEMVGVALRAQAKAKPRMRTREHSTTTES
jgi:GntR family transcriptional regulator, carbon starvation induced regulator